MEQPKQPAKKLNFSGGKNITPEKNDKSIQEQIEEILPEKEHSQVVHEEYGLTLEEVIHAFYDSEIGMSRIFTKIYRNRFCFNTSLNTWFVYKEGRWQQDDKREHIDAIREMYSLLLNIKNKFLSNLEEDTEKMVAREIKKLSQIKNMELLLKQAASGRDGLGVLDEHFDQELRYVGVPNGVIDLKTGELLPTNPELYNTRQVGVSYDPAAPEPRRFKQFLHDIFKYPLEKEKVNLSDDEFQRACQEQCESLVTYIQTLFGYAFLGICKEHLFICFYGLGRNGKGVVIRTVNRVMGNYAGEIAPAILMNQRNTSASSPTPEIGDLKGMRLVVASETNQGQFFDTSAIKRLTGGDILVFRKPYAKDFIRFRPSHTIILQTNFRPNAPAEDSAFWDRIQVVPFLRRFVENPDPANIYEAEIDKDLEDKLSEELPGILNWLVEGARMYIENGLYPPECIKNAVNEYRHSRDFIADFIEECCTTGPVQNIRVRTTAFVQALNEWRKVQGFRSPLPSSVITERLESKGFIKRKSNFQCYKGLTLKPVGEEYLKPVNERRICFQAGDEQPFMDPAAGQVHQPEGDLDDFDIA